MGHPHFLDSKSKGIVGIVAFDYVLRVRNMWVALGEAMWWVSS